MYLAVRLAHEMFLLLQGASSELTSVMPAISDKLVEHTLMFSYGNNTL